jgi:hypothetical protein
MISERNSKILTLLIFIVFIYFIQVISNYDKSTPDIEYERSIVKPSYGNEFWNYYGGESTDGEDEDEMKDNIQEIIVEGFGPFSTMEDAIRDTHETCPVMEGNTATITTCIQFPNNNLQGLPGPVDSGFLVSVCCDMCINTIQTSFNNNTGEYNIIYENDNYILTKDNEMKQVVLPCSPENRDMITQIRR